jgi:hypothetical protein
MQPLLKVVWRFLKKLKSQETTSIWSSDTSAWPLPKVM